MNWNVFIWDGRGFEFNLSPVRQALDLILIIHVHKVIPDISESESESNSRGFCDSIIDSIISFIQIFIQFFFLFSFL